MVQAGTSAFANGRLDAAREATLELAWEAVRRAMGDLAFAPVDTWTSGDTPGGPADAYHQPLTAPVPNDGAPAGAFFLARADGGGEIRIRLISKSAAVTKISIRVGLLGDQALSRLILETIDGHLASDEPAALDPPPSLYGPR